MHLFNNLWKAAQGAASTLVPESNIPCKTETTGGPMGRTWQAKEASDTQEKDIVTSNMFQPVANAKTESISIVSKRPNGPPCQSITISFFQQKHDQYCTMYIYVYIYSLFLKIEHCNSITLFLNYIYICNYQYFLHTKSKVLAPQVLFSLNCRSSSSLVSSPAASMLISNQSLVFSSRAEKLLGWLIEVLWETTYS